MDVCNETVAMKALMSGSFAGLRPGLDWQAFFQCLAAFGIHGIAATFGCFGCIDGLLR